ncbi:hypothetical protein [Cellulomonas fengjieae]|uniref:Peptidase n=1 Tax=Cellulomonas fengjieae TaxID=2819978 RepID=A0ABS3SI66_9CELL|nr:hypothetical protein [Cellulomonas fengjieae]MBO3084665.1 hypothetical protein [Cellulomonas fengjieae]QVI67011.1 hypothetical protein KG102_05330 [Cellulomonas fengjieae]
MLLAVALIGFLALAASIVVRWMGRRVDSLGRIAPFPRISVGLALAMATCCAIPMMVEAWVEHRLEGAASRVAGEPVEVHCQSLGQAFVDVGGELGYVRWGPDGVPERSTLIKFGPCGNLRAWLGSTKASPSLDQVVAVHVVTHETMHMEGIVNEAQAECAAMQRDAAMATELGASPVEAQALARRYWVEVYPNMPSEYVGGCGPGGTYDEGLPTPPW